MFRLLAQLGLAVVSLCVVQTASAQADAEPKVPALVKIVVPFSAGASNDSIARVIAPLLAKRLGNNVIVENKPGAAGVIGADSVAKSPRDGSVLLLTSSTFLTAAATQSKLPYDPLTAFAPVAMVAQGPMLLAVSASTTIKSPADLVAAARAKGGAMTYGTAGIGSIAHMTTEMLSDSAKIQLSHVPYKGAANALMDMAAGQIDMMISNYSSLAPQIKAGRVRPIAVTTRETTPSFPGLPSLSSVAPGFSADIWVSVMAPAGTPASLVEKLNREINEISASPQVRALLESDGAVPTPLTPAELSARIKEDLSRWKKIATDKKIVAE